MKKEKSTDFCADRIGIITNFAVRTNAVIKGLTVLYICMCDKVDRICLNQQELGAGERRIIFLY